MQRQAAAVPYLTHLANRTSAIVSPTDSPDGEEAFAYPPRLSKEAPMKV